MRVVMGTILGVLAIVAGCPNVQALQPPPVPRPDAVATATGTISRADLQREVARLRSALTQEVPQHIGGNADSDRVWIARAEAAISRSPLTIQGAQLVVVVDRSPAVQELRIMLAQPNGDWQVIGGTKVSTGQRGRQGYYITPVGVFLHTDDILDYRALGTFNENHIRGLGLKGMRVWDFGWQTADRGWGSNPDPSDIRLLMHATDPEYLERRIGRPASKGCIRIPAAMNRFLDMYGVLDADYERDARDDRSVSSILLPDRRPTPLAGNTLVVLDSSR